MCVDGAEIELQSIRGDVRGIEEDAADADEGFAAAGPADGERFVERVAAICGFTRERRRVPVDGYDDGEAAGERFRCGDFCGQRRSSVDVHFVRREALPGEFER